MAAQAHDKDLYYMQLAEVAATRSKDPNTKVGSCIVKDGRILSLGYNGAPRKFPDDEVPTCRDLTRPLSEQKYPYIVHAELNSILSYRGDLSNLEGAKLYVTASPCYECAKAISQVGISEVIYKEEYKRIDYWNISKTILDKCGVKYRRLGNEVTD